MYRTWRDILLKEDKNIERYMRKLKYTEPITCMIARNKLLSKRVSYKEDFEFTKENFEDLFLEYFSNQDINYIEECIKINNWTIKDLYRKVVATGSSTLQVVGCPNPFQMVGCPQ
ncbi:hypothetical protein KYB31_23295 [Clostridium felsineum]|uniref:hypothetical protein n=1 Tax=Clostridium felsineum TaxID=36839 RepID=UPI00214D470D|nr:hypothetical protein [Clostridium felsineum]MCR3761904.1 hypothetical protein [Clostridium felsineum]